MNLLYRRNIMYPQQSVSAWLTKAAVQTIISAFGSDGYAVIAATNEYLNGIAASDKAKATALAGFINEDPMMVCSLGLEPQGVTMPVRWLVGDDNSWIDTGVKATPATIANTKVKYNSSVNITMAMFGVRTSAGEHTTAFYVAYSAGWLNIEMRQFNGSNVERHMVLASGIYEVTLKPNEFILNGTSYSAGTNVGSDYNIFAMTVKNGAGTFNDKMQGQGMAFLELKNTSGGDENLIPFVSPTRDGMIDLVNMEFHPNQGTGHFTDAYTLPDGTPWTPPTP